MVGVVGGMRGQRRGRRLLLMGRILEEVGTEGMGVMVIGSRTAEDASAVQGMMLLLL